jgi:hypothetical protein
MRHKSEYQELREMSAAVASRYVRRMAELESNGFGDDDNALRRLEAKFGLSYWTLRYLKLGRSTKIDTDIFQQIRGAYLSYCEHKISALQHELRTEREIEPDADLENLEAQASELAAKIKEAKTRRLLRRGRG